MERSEATPRVIVIGAGLLTAQALKKQGINVTVFEQATSLSERPRDWNFGLYWAQSPLAECLPDELSAQVEDTQIDERKPSPDDKLRTFNAQSGELLKDIPVPNYLRLAKRRFCQMLTQGLDIRWGKRLVAASSDGRKATATFEDGSSETADLLVGGEGAHSLVRKYLVGPERAALKASPLVASATMAKLPALAAEELIRLSPRHVILFHPLGYFVWLGVHDKYGDSRPGDWTFMIIFSWIPKEEDDYRPGSLQGPAILADMKRRARDFAEPFNMIFQAIPEGTRCWHNRLSYWIPEPWDNRNGTVTLVGDAAHPMTFHRGQGLNNAIHDVASLSRSLREGGISPEAVGAYEREMWQRGREAVVSSNNNSMATHNWDTLMQSALLRVGAKQDGRA
ncbi:hypothetical protein DL770_003734 [Monosporascus sp. CRB-9-2]|nr:hypothetical protein DL770_003734 [Monosporascus sp. CRB-9-2]